MRQLGLLINRRGQIEYIIVGDAHRVYLPDIGRVRAGQERLRGLRHIHTVFTSNGLSDDDISDLELLRLDFVVSINASQGRAGEIHYAHLLANLGGKSSNWIEQQVRSALDLDIDALAFLLELEADLRKSQAQLQAPTEGREKAVIVHVTTKGKAHAQSSLKELRELAHTANLPIVDEVIQVRKKIDPRYVCGKGKLEEIVLTALHRGAEIILFDTNLQPTQVRAITNETDLKVIDRTQLILDIFAHRAKSKDGKLQVELAQLKYTLPRLIQKNTAMSRLTGGIGGIGPGETKLEINRRRVRDRITNLEREINRISKQRGLRRKARKRSGIPVVSIVGYTNAGKSTLLNLVTQSKVLSEDKLFATLDPASRRVRFPKNREVLFTDTMGFIRELPLDLISAFRATLEELTEADLLIHLIDGSDKEREQKAFVVHNTLEELKLGDAAVFTVYNKMDLMNGEDLENLKAHGNFCISAKTANGIDKLLESIESFLWLEPKTYDVQAS